MIPKIIHYCWFGGKTIPETLQNYMTTWHKLMPDWEIVRDIVALGPHQVVLQNNVAKELMPLMEHVDYTMKTYGIK